MTSTRPDATGERAYRLEVVDAAGFAPWVDDSVEIYLQALERPGSLAPGRRASTRDHLDEPGLRAVLAHQGYHLVGFAYGYADTPHQWWREVIVGVLDADERRTWFGSAYQVTELHVLPEHQGHGLGRRLITALLDGVDARTAVLSAYDRPTPARRLYASLGFVDLLRDFRFPGNTERYAVMGAPLPLRRVDA